MSSSALIAAGVPALLSTYRPQPIVLASGQGCRVTDVDGRGYLDFTAGVAACSLGHAHPRLRDAIVRQAETLLHVSNLFYSRPQLELAQALSQRTAGGQVFFCNSGTEANEAALKLARRYQLVIREQPARTTLVAFDQSFHGRTWGSLAVTGQAKHRAGFGALCGPVRFCRYGDVDAARAAIGDDTIAVIVEPIQGEGGVVVPPADFLPALRRACDDKGALLIVDEVQTGIGRTGALFASQAAGVVPDLLTSAKGLGGGVPIGALIARPEIARGFGPGSHASTFGGNPLACAAALAVLHTLDEEALLPRVTAAGERLGRGLEALCPAHGVEARGRGLLRGLVVRADAPALQARARERGLLLSVAGGNVLRLTPPLIVADDEIDEALSILTQTFEEA